MFLQKLKKKPIWVYSSSPHLSSSEQKKENVGFLFFCLPSDYFCIYEAENTLLLFQNR